MTQVAVRPEPKAPLQTGGSLGAIIPQDAESAFRMAQLIVKGGMAPKDMQSPEKVVIAIFHGMEVGLKPMQAIQSIALVNGRPALWGDAAIGLCLASGLAEDIAETMEGAGDTLTAVCKAKRLGMSTVVERRFGVADAKKAGLWGKTGPWTQYPQRMLQMRARGFCLRDAFPDVLKGLAVAEEVRDAQARPVNLGEIQSQPVGARALIEQAREEPEEAEAQATETTDPETGEVTQPTTPDPYVIRDRAGRPKSGRAAYDDPQEAAEALGDYLEATAPEHREAVYQANAALVARVQEVGGDSEAVMDALNHVARVAFEKAPAA